MTNILRKSLCFFIFLLISLILLRLFLTSSYFNLHPNPHKKVVVVFRNDDIQEYTGTASERRFIKLFEENGIPQTYALVPFKRKLKENHDLLAMLKKQQASGLAEIALHGYTHENHQGRRKSEFACRSLEVQREEIGTGKKYLEQIFPGEITTFIPPFNSYDENTLRACAENGIKVLSSSHFFPVPNKCPVQVVNHNFLLTDPATYIDLAGRNGGNLSIFIVYYHSYMEDIYRSDDYFGKAAILIRLIKEHPNIEVATLGNTALRYADYFQERRTIDTWWAKTSVLLSFYRQYALLDKLKALYHCDEKRTYSFIGASLLFVMGAVFLMGFLTGIFMNFFLNFSFLSSPWLQQCLFVLSMVWLTLMFLLITDKSFGIIDFSLEIMLSGFLLLFFTTVKKNA